MEEVMKTLTQLTLASLISSSLFAQGDLCIQNYKIGYDAQKSKEQILPAVGVTLQPSYSQNISFIVAYADDLFMQEKRAGSDEKIKNIYFTLSYNF